MPYKLYSFLSEHSPEDCNSEDSDTILQIAATIPLKISQGHAVKMRLE